MKYYFLAFKKYVDFNGRSRRSEYWYFVLFHIIAIILILLLSDAINFPFLYPIYYLATIIPYLALIVRRMHDVDKSGWYCLIPIYNLVLCCTEGTPGRNEYGQNPKEDPYTFDFEMEQPVS